MKILKFRGYCEHCGKMYKLCDLNCRVWEGGVEASCEKHSIFTEVVLQQFTGLLDKRGKEIYEGDIVDTLTPLRKKVGKKNYIIVGEYVSERVLVEWETGMYHKWSIGDRQAKDAEVIGNLHENSDLLEVAND